MSIHVHHQLSQWAFSFTSPEEAKARFRSFYATKPAEVFPVFMTSKESSEVIVCSVAHSGDKPRLNHVLKEARFSDRNIRLSSRREIEVYLASLEDEHPSP